MSVTIAERLVRYAELQPCTTAFIDARTPGSDRKENFTIIGPGVAENPAQHVHIAEPHGFNIGGARQPPHCVNSQHYHESAEAFFAHSSRWAVTLGEHGEDASHVLERGDLVSVPVHVFRGFENVGDETGFLYFMLGGDDPGRVTWAPDVLQRATAHGLILLENGRLVDSAMGEAVPADASPVAPQTPENLARIVRRMNIDDLRSVIVRLDEARPFQANYAMPGVEEAAMIGPANREEGAPAGKLGWLHGFVTRRLALQPGTRSKLHRRAEPEVIFVHEGELDLQVDGETISIGPGDTISVPIGATRRFAARGSVQALVTRAGNTPRAAEVVE